MGKTLTWTILGINKASPAFKEIAKDTETAGKKLDDFGIRGSKSLDGVTDSAAKAKKAAEDMAVRMSSAVEKASEKLAKARQSEADQLGRLRVAKENLIALEEKGSATRLQTARAEEAVAAALRRVEAAQKAVVSGQDKLNTARDAAIAQARKEAAEANVKPKIEFDIKGGLDGIKAAAISELKSAGIIAGATMGSGIAAGLTSVGVAGMFIGIAAAAQSSNEDVKRAYSTMWEDIKAKARQDSGVLADEFIAGAEKIGRTFNELRPQMQEAFTASQPAANDLYDGFNRLARQAMPGFVVGAKASALASDNVADAMESTGRAITNFITESAKGAEAGGEAISSFGRIIERLGSFGGRVLAELANNSATVFPALESAVGSAATAVENLASSALPSLAGGAALGLTGLSLLLNLANALISALGPLAPEILTVVTSLKLVDMLTFGGVSKSWETFKQSIADAPGFAGKAKAGLSGLVGTLGPMGIAAGIGAIALTSLGESQQRAAADAAAHRGRVQSLTDALRASNGAIDGNVKALAAKSLSEQQVGTTGKTVLEVARESGVALGFLTDAYLGNADAQQAVNNQLTEFIKSRAVEGTAMDEVASRANELRNDVLPGLNGEYKTSAQRAKDLAEAQGDVAKATQESAEALQKLRDQIDAMVNKDLAYRNSIESTKDAQVALAEAQKTAAGELKAHGKNSKEYAGATEEVADASRGLEGAYISQAQAARDLATANSLATDDIDRGKDGANAYTQEVLKMTIAAGTNAPRALQMMAAKLTDADLQAIGAKKHINELGQTVITLPDGKTITVRAEDNATSVIRQIAGGRYVATIRLQADMSGYYRTVGQGSVLSGSSARGNATGGWIRGPGTETSDSIPRMLSNNEFVVRASEAKKNGPLLEAMNSGRLNAASLAAGVPGMVSGGSSGGQPIVVHTHLHLDGREIGVASSKFLRADIQGKAGGDSVGYFKARV